eukprot:353123-Chlamydomonas_euryale.AAC.2
MHAQACACSLSGGRLGAHPQHQRLNRLQERPPQRREVHTRAPPAAASAAVAVAAGEHLPRAREQV